MLAWPSHSPPSTTRSSSRPLLHPAPADPTRRETAPVTPADCSPPCAARHELAHRFDVPRCRRRTDWGSAAGINHPVLVTIAAGKDASRCARELATSRRFVDPSPPLPWSDVPKTNDRHLRKQAKGRIVVGAR
jgi:hypothetical protein